MQSPDQDQQFAQQLHAARSDNSVTCLEADSLACRAAFAFFDALGDLGRTKSNFFKARRSAIHKVAPSRLSRQQFSEVRRGLQVAENAVRTQMTRSFAAALA